MIKKLIAVLLVALAIFNVSCGGGADISPVSDAIAGRGDTSSARFTLNIQIADVKTTIMYSQGSFDADYKNNTLVAQMATTVLATPAAITLEYDGETLKKTENNTESTQKLEAEALFGGLTYVRPFLPESDFKSDESVDGLYTVNWKSPDSAMLLALLGDGIYNMCAIKTPIKDKAFCEDVVMTYRVSDGMITDFSMAFTAHLFETPPYVPGKDVDESDYELELTVEYTAAYIKK